MPDPTAVRRLPLDDPASRASDPLAAGSLFGSRGFLELWRAKGGRPVMWTVWTDGAPAAALPAVEYGRWPLTRLAALPDGFYPRLGVDPALGPRAPTLARALLDAVARHAYSRIHLFDFHGAMGAPAGYERRRLVTRVVELGDLSRWPPDAKLRSQIRKAEREGIEIVPYDPRRHRAGLLALVERTYLRHGLPPRYPPALYDALAALAARDPRVIWRWCEHRGEPVASHIYLVEGDMVLAWQSYFDKRFSFLKPNVAIRHRVALEAAGLGLARLNLGSTPPGAAGLAYFKGRWGGRRIAFAGLLREAWPIGMLEALRSRSLPATTSRRLEAAGATG